MSTVKSKKLQVGTDATASNNFTIYQPSTPDGTLRIGQGTADNPTEVARITVDGVADANGNLLSNTPMMQSIMGANTTITHNTATLVPYSVEQIDTDNAYNTSTYTFTVPTGKDGIYFIHAETRVDDGTSSIKNALLKIQKNGGDLGRNYQNTFNNPPTALQLSVSGSWSLVGGDEIKVYCQMATVDGVSGTLSAGTYNRFHIHRLIA